MSRVSLAPLMAIVFYFMKEEELGELRKGEILCRALFISVDPITRYHRTKPLGMVEEGWLSLEMG